MSHKAGRKVQIGKINFPPGENEGNVTKVVTVELGLQG